MVDGRVVQLKIRAADMFWYSYRFDPIVQRRIVTRMRWTSYELWTTVL